MTPYQVAELISLTLTVPTLFTALAVTWVWGPACIRSLRDWPELNDQQWLISGVVCGFVGGFLDNLYWSIPWTASYLGSEHEWGLMQTGVFLNIVFRQAFGIVAAYCHLKAAALSNSKSRKALNVTLAACWIGGCLTAMTLLLLS